MAAPATATRPLRRLLRHPVAVAAACALVFSLIVEAAPVVGGDLAAQEWWTSWASTHRPPVDLGWYGGLPVPSYSLLSPWASALLGLPLAGMLGTVVGTAATTALLGRLGPTPVRWNLAGISAAAMWTANEWSGRTTFGLGAALGCLALVVASGAGRRARVGAVVLAALAGATSPVASVLLLVAAAGWWCGSQPGLRHVRLRRGPVAPWLLAGGALLPVVVARLLGAVSGPQPTSAHQMVGAIAATALSAAVVPARHRMLRAGIAWTGVLLLATWLISTPVGSTSVRMVLLFAIPLVVAVARTRPAATLLAALAIGWLLPPLVVKDLVPRDQTAASARADDLLAELAVRGPVGRIEVVPEQTHEESVWVARGVPVARGWLRQVDTVRSAPLYDDSLDAAGYLHWLRRAGVEYVALPKARLDWASGREAVLLRRGVPGLHEVWSDSSWRLFQVSGGSAVHGDATLVSSDRSRLVVDVSRVGSVDVALWWSRWSSVEGPDGCVRPGTREGWTTLVTDRPGRYVLTSSWHPEGQCG